MCPRVAPEESRRCPGKLAPASWPGWGLYPGVNQSHRYQALKYQCETEACNDRGRCHRKPAIDYRPLSGNARDQPPRVDRHESDRDQRGRQAQTEGQNQVESEGHAM